MGGTRILRAVCRCEKAEVEERILDSMLITAGERDFANVTITDVVRHARVSHFTFYRYFGGTEECFERAYDLAANRLWEEVVAADADAAGWREEFRAGLATLFRFVADQPIVAKALFIDVHAAGKGARANQNKFVERYSRPVDTGRRETGFHSPPPLTAELIVGAIESSVCMRISAQDTASVVQLLPELAHFVVLYYFGEGSAGSELG
jgi:AcrR family transcriptional regulator